MARVEGWYFNQLGQFLERADKTSRILDVKYHLLLPSAQEVGSSLDFLQWAALLKSVSGFNTYRRFYGNLQPSGVVEFLVFNKYFPRSILFCLREAENCLHRLSGTEEGYSNKAEKRIGTLRSELEFADVEDLISFGLHEYLDGIQLKLNGISDEIYDKFFRVTNNLTAQQQVQ